MKNRNQHLIVDQVNKNLYAFTSLKDNKRPSAGWIHAIRAGVRMSLRQMGQRLHVSPQSVKELEMREVYGTVTLEALNKAGKALNMRLIYGFIPEDGSLHEMIENRAREVATRVVMRTSATMVLEGQENSSERNEKAIEELTEELVREMPGYLWD